MAARLHGAKELNLIPPLAFVKKAPRMPDDYRVFRWWQGK